MIVNMKHLKLSTSNKLYVYNNYSDFEIEDELSSYHRINGKDIGLNVDLLVDTEKKYIANKHPLWLYVYRQDYYVPITIDKSNPLIVTGLNIPLRRLDSVDIIEIKDFITTHYLELTDLANEILTPLEFDDTIYADQDYYSIDECLSDLNEMSKLTTVETGLPMDIWLDECGTYKLGGHPKIVKFNAIKGNTNSRKYSSIEIEGQHELHDVPEHSPIKSSDIEKLKEFVIANQNDLSLLADAKITMKDFVVSMHKVKSEETKLTYKRLFLAHTTPKIYVVICNENKKQTLVNEHGEPMIDDLFDAVTRYNVIDKCFYAYNKNRVIRLDINGHIIK